MHTFIISGVSLLFPFYLLLWLGAPVLIAALAGLFVNGICYMLYYR